MPHTVADAITAIAAAARGSSVQPEAARSPSDQPPAARGASDQPEAYLVGGAVRDALLGRPVAELDIASTDLETTASQFADLFDSSVVSLGGDHELRRVPLADGWIDVTPIAGSIEDDLDRRDFTIDAPGDPDRMPHTVADAITAIAAAARGSSDHPEAYLVGGAVRDALLGRPVTELDVASTDLETTASQFADLLGSSVVSLGGDYELRRVPLADGWIDITPIAGSIEDDLDRRDFTIDALALPLAALPDRLEALQRHEVIDRHDGLADLDRRLVRQLSATAIADDPIRALRAIRLATVLDFTIDPDTERSIAAAATFLSNVAAERVGSELSRIFASERSAVGLRLLEQTALLDFCFPELIAGRGVTQRPNHTWDVLDHQLVALEWIDVLLATEPPEEESAAAIWHITWDTAWPATPWGEVRDHIEAHAPILRLATLLHDIGKPSTRTVEADGRTRFFGHGPRGAEMAAVRLRTWRFPERTINRVMLLLQQHLRPGQVSAPGEPPSARALHRFHRRLGDATPDVCLLFLADSLATAGAEELLPRWAAYVAHVQRIACWHPPASAQTIAHLVDGHAVIEATGLAPGPAIGAILEAIAEAAAAGELVDAGAALDLARRLAAGQR